MEKRERTSREKTQRAFDDVRLAHEEQSAARRDRVNASVKRIMREHRATFAALARS